MSASPDPAAPAPAAAEEKPQSLIDKLGTALPIAMTALATVFAGMSSSELQRAMFWRTAAGQDQARATNQWTFAGLKRNRSLIMEATSAQIGAMAAGKPLDLGTPGEKEKEAADWLKGKGPPRASLPKVENAHIVAVLDAIAKRMAEEEILKLAAQIKPAEINAAIDAAASYVAATDKAWDDTLKAAGRLAAKRPGDAALQAARFALEQRRYRGESSLELGIGFLYDARVRVVTAISDKHRKRSENFFFAMLAGQIGAVVSTLAMARKQQSVLWLLAGVLGATALGFGAFVYLTV